MATRYSKEENAFQEDVLAAILKFKLVVKADALALNLSKHNEKEFVQARLGKLIAYYFNVQGMRILMERYQKDDLE